MHGSSVGAAVFRMHMGKSRIQQEGNVQQYLSDLSPVVLESSPGVLNI